MRVLRCKGLDARAENFVAKTALANACDKRQSKAAFLMILGDFVRRSALGEVAFRNLVNFHHLVKLQ